MCRKPSNVNPIYAQLRNAAWAEAQASGNLTPDPRSLANLDRVRSLPATGALSPRRRRVIDADALSEWPAGRFHEGDHRAPSELPTPLIASVMYYITYNPDWHAPDHLVRKTIAPNVLKLGNGLFQVARLTTSSTNGASMRMLHRRQDDRLESRGGGHASSEDSSGSRSAEFNGTSKFPFPNPLGY